MDKLLEILEDLDDSIDWENESQLIKERKLDSFGIITLVSELEDAFDIEIEASMITPDNFNSVEKMWDMIQELMEN